MNARIPPGTNAEKVEFARRWMRQQQLAIPSVRLSRRARRVVVVCLYCLLMVSPFVFTRWATTTNLDRATFLGFWGFTMAMVVLWGALLMSVPSSQRRRRAELDERERSERDMATANAYWIVTVVVAVATFYLAVAATTGFGWPTPSANAARALLLCFMWVVITLPTAIIAWKVAAPPPET